MYYKLGGGALIKCTLCGLIKTEHPEIEFHPVIKGGTKLWICHRCKINEDMLERQKKNGLKDVMLVFQPKE